jgi:hypothetical protein
LDAILQLLNYIHTFATIHCQNDATTVAMNIDNDFHSKKLNNKLLEQVDDAIVIASSSLPLWTSWLIHSYRFFYPVDTRQLYFRTTSFGTTRSIVWLQERREDLIRTIRHGRSRLAADNVSTSSSLQEFRFGRLKIDRATPIDREHILRDAMHLFHFHAHLKAKLEIQFLNEEGTGDGPTLEFYALVANEMQKYKLGLWWNDIDEQEHQQSTEYVRKVQGLFPVPYASTSTKLDEICSYFSLMGIYFAKCLLDKYIIDMPLSVAFIKLLCTASPSMDDGDRWFENILNLDDFMLIEPIRAKFFKQLLQLINKRDEIRRQDHLSANEKIRQCHLLQIESDVHEPMNIDTLRYTVMFVVRMHNNEQSNVFYTI